MEDPKQQLVEKLQAANDVLVTVSRNPSVDQLASCIGLALFLNKQNKHTAAVFSGEVPSTLEFLQPEETLEKTTDSLRDFIIALDKSKADKLRYKVEDNVVRIFITPYKTSIDEDDLEFSQGDFNVDLVVALGVGKQEDLDEAITVHGRILHDATVATINIGGEAGIGSINLNDPGASSLSELVTDLTQALDPGLMDKQIATALLTGIVSATDRFSNDKTSSQAMGASALLMNAGANQQLVASKLEEPPAPPKPPVPDEPKDEEPQDGTIEIDHSHDPPPPPKKEDKEEVESIEGKNDEKVNDKPVPEEPKLDDPSSSPKLVTEPPQLGSPLTANSQQQPLEPSSDPLSLPTAEAPQLLDRKPEQSGFTPPPSDWAPPATTDDDDSKKPSDDRTLSKIEAEVKSSKATLSDLEAEVKKEEAEQESDKKDVKDVREEVNEALSDAPETPAPIKALNSQPLGEDLHPDSDKDAKSDSPPPVPPPIPFQFGGQQDKSS